MVQWRIFAFAIDFDLFGAELQPTVIQQRRIFIQIGRIQPAKFQWRATMSLIAGFLLGSIVGFVVAALGGAEVSKIKAKVMEFFK